MIATRFAARNDIFGKVSRICANLSTISRAEQRQAKEDAKLLRQSTYEVSCMIFTIFLNIELISFIVCR